MIECIRMVRSLPCIAYFEPACLNHWSMSNVEILNVECSIILPSRQVKQRPRRKNRESSNASLGVELGAGLIINGSF